MKKLAISFITYNRAKHIKEDLDTIVRPTKEYGIDIYIYDGSTNRHLEYIVRKYIEKGYNHIYYFHTDDALSITDSMMQRVNKALKEPDAEYVWLCGDKFVVKPEYYPELLSYIDKSYDIITIYERILKGTRKFHNPSQFLDYVIVPITHFGATIIRKQIIDPFDIDSVVVEENPSFYVQLIYARAIANIKEFKGVAIDGGEKVSLQSRFQTDSNWQSHVWHSWVINWYRFICLLPDTYESIREGLFNRIDKEVHFFSMRMLLSQRFEGQLDWNRSIKYRKYVKKVIVIPSMVVFGIALLPKGIAKWLYDFLCSKEYRWIERKITKLSECITRRS